MWVARKGSISGNHAMQNADAVIMIGSRAVCQADCSGIGYPNARAVLNINGDLDDLTHYANTLCLPGDITAVIDMLLAAALGNQTQVPICAGTGCKTAQTRKTTGPISRQKEFMPNR